MIAYPELTSRDDLLKMLDELADHRAELLTAVEALTPAQQLDSVIPGSWNVLQTLAHLAWAEAWMLAWMPPGPAYSPPQTARRNRRPNWTRYAQRSTKPTRPFMRS